VVAAAGLVGVVGLGLYFGVSESATELEAARTPQQPDVVNVAPAPSAPPPVVGVVRVVDADSLEVAGGASGPVEVLGILAPQDGQCGADVARRFATTKLLGTAVTLVAEPSQPSVDGAGRILAHVRLPNGVDYAVLAARAGVVKYHESGVPVARAEEIKAAQAEAEASNEGLWGAPCHGDFAAGQATGPE
jgi:micrococcal nuclease